ncbi:MAG TPA: polysaccharide deacetylase family protein [Acidimicrobiales bacterium]|nr:polysaccharide deacetylase family protein [Acidimicrobiales bacterium]
MPALHVRPLASVVLLVALVGCADRGERAVPPSSTTSTDPVTTTLPPSTTTTATGGPATVVSRGNPDRRVVALTFDAGADAGFTAQILDTLDRSGVPATFGITGRWAEAHPELVRRIAAAGHLLMNHTYEHRSFTGVSAHPAVLSAAERRADVERTDEVIRGLTGHSTRPWFRPPYGDYDASVNAAVGALGYRYNVLWTVDSLGWQGRSPAAITARCLDGAVPGAILLFHVGAASQDAAALPDVLAGLRQRGYELGTVADVVGG